jgi:signal transduction histidine kinase
MQKTPRNVLAFGILAAVWCLMIGWQIGEHFRVRAAERTKLVDRAKDISSTVTTMVRYQRSRWSGRISREQLESELTELLRPDELTGIGLLNEAGDVVASAGTLVTPPRTAEPGSEYWNEQTVTLLNPVALGTNLTQDLEAIVFSRTNMPPPPMGGLPPPGGGPPLPGAGPPARLPDTTSTNPPIAVSAPRDTEPSTRVPVGADTNSNTVISLAASNAPASISTNFARGRGGGPGRRGLARPPWMPEPEWNALLKRQGLHSFAIVLSTRSYLDACNRDAWLRLFIGLLVTISVIGSGIAWTNTVKNSELQIRLVRTSELNSHLKEMNLAAAGLAHETRNPLNIIRGLAQLISKQEDASPETKRKLLDIVNETDRVTAQLNEFINYSKPREVRRTPVALNSVINEVVRALNYDIEEKLIHLQVKGEPLTIHADEQLLRQALFNLLLNATQAVDAGGEIEIEVQRQNGTEGILEVRDNGPGVPSDRRTEIFKPYFTTHQKGTGLGLAVVHQIVLAHGWEIECLSSDPHGAIFRISHLKLA